MSLTNVFVAQQGSSGNPKWALPELLCELAQGGDTDLVLALIRAFEDDTALRLRDTENAAASGDRAVLRKQAHAIKGSARQMGATALAAGCEQVELSASDVLVSQLLAYIDTAEIEFAKVCGEMSSYSPELVRKIGNKP